jgi:site-specific recombinase XerD
VTRCGLCVSYGASTLRKPTYSFPSAADQSAPSVSTASSSASARPPRCHPHMLRHACGFKLANDGHDTRALQHYLGHKNIQHTVRYTEMAPDRFKDFWRG